MSERIKARIEVSEPDWVMAWTWVIQFEEEGAWIAGRLCTQDKESAQADAERWAKKLNLEILDD